MIATVSELKHLHDRWALWEIVAIASMDAYLKDLNDEEVDDREGEQFVEPPDDGSDDGEDDSSMVEKPAAAASSVVMKKPAAAASLVVKKPAAAAAAAAASSVLKRPAAAIRNDEDGCNELRDRLKARKFDKMVDCLPLCCG